LAAYRALEREEALLRVITQQDQVTATPSTGSLIGLRGVTKTYETPRGPFTALRDVCLEVHAGELVAIVGRSGSGKSTLANLITGIDRPTSGEILIDGTHVDRMSQRQLALWRGRTIGIVFQLFQLLPTLTVAENVMLPMELCGTYPVPERLPRALDLLDRVGVRAQADKLPSDLSGGEQQRSAIARALANDPPILVADEPTGNLDSQNGDLVLGLFAGLAVEGKTVLMVTHERDVTRFARRVVTLVDGVASVEEAAPKLDAGSSQADPTIGAHHG
jgi:putative ABC transport system ATP-binding protein